VKVLFTTSPGYGHMQVVEVASVDQVTIEVDAMPAPADLVARLVELAG
jgi:hypothetical protein